MKLSPSASPAPWRAIARFAVYRWRQCDFVFARAAARKKASFLAKAMERSPLFS
jgi:hypothetical protein